MKTIISISLGSSHRNDQTTATLFGQDVHIQRIGTDGDMHQAAALIQRYQGQVDAISIETGGQYPFPLPKIAHARLMAHATKNATPLVFGTALKATLERWAIKRLADAQPSLFPKRRVVLLNGMSRIPLVQALSAYAPHMRFADPLLPMPFLPLPTPRSLKQLHWYATTLAPMALMRPSPSPPQQGSMLPCLHGQGGHAPSSRLSARLPIQRLMAWADIIIGDYATLSCWLPATLHKKVVITDNPTAAERDDLVARKLQTLITFAPAFSPNDQHFSTETLEAILVVTHPGEDILEESRLLDRLSTLNWQPMVYPLNPTHPKPQFAFVVHPLTTQQIALHPDFRFTRYLPPRLVEWAAAYLQPLLLSRIRGIRSKATGEEVQGVMLALTATPREMLRRPPDFTYQRLLKAARMAEHRGAKIMGLGAFTSIVGDAGVTVARQSPIGITSGNSLTVAATLEAAKQAAQRLGKPIDQGCALVLGATGSIGAVCSRLLAMALHEVILIAPRPERLLALKMLIEQETPGARITIATTPDPHSARADLIITTTSSLQGHVLTIELLKPGAIVCDVARPPNVLQEEANRRPDVLVIESGEIVLPGTPDFGFNIDLPPGTAYACLAETVVLAMEGRTEHYTVGRSIDPAQVKEMYRLMQKHGLELAALRSFGKVITAEDIAEKRRLAAVRLQQYA